MPCPWGVLDGGRRRVRWEREGSTRSVSARACLRAASPGSVLVSSPPWTACCLRPSRDLENLFCLGCFVLPRAVSKPCRDKRQALRPARNKWVSSQPFQSSGKGPGWAGKPRHQVLTARPAAAGSPPGEANPVHGRAPPSCPHVRVGRRLWGLLQGPRSHSLPPQAPNTTTLGLGSTA